MPEPTIYPGTFTQCVDAFVQRTLDQKDLDVLSPIVSLVGSNAMRTELRNSLHKASGGILGIYTLTFKDLVERLGAPYLLAKGKKPVEKLYHLALIKHLINEKGRHFTNVAQFDGTSQALSQTFEDISEAGWKTICARSTSTPKIDEITQIFDELRDTLSNKGFYTLQELFDTARENAPLFSSIFQCSNLHVVGIYDVNAKQNDLLIELAKHIKLHFYIPQVVNRSNWATQKGVEAVSMFVADKQRTHILSCPSPIGEVREIVREAKRFRYQLNNPVPFQKMGVLLRHIDEYADLFADICNEADVPCKIHGGCSPVDSLSLRLLGRLTTLLDFSSGNDSPLPLLKRADVISFLGACRLAPGASWPADIRVMQRYWDFISRDAHIRKGEDWNRQLKKYSQLKEESALGRSADVLLSAVDILSDGLTKIGGAKNYKAAVSHFELLTKQFIDPDESCKKALESLDTLKQLDDAQEAFDPLRFQSLLLEMIHDVKDFTRCTDPEGLQIMDMAASRGLCFDIIFIPGCVESMIPFLGKPDPILLDYERRMLNSDNPGRPLPLFSDRPDNERNLFDLACRAASQRLIFTYHRLDAGMEKPRLPSHYLLSIFGATGSMDDFIRDYVKHISSGLPVLKNLHMAHSSDERDMSLMKSLAAIDPAGPISFLRNARPEFERTWRKQLHRWAQRGIGPWEGLCESEKARQLIANRLKEAEAFQATEIEAYVKCPRRYMFSHMLNLKRPDTPEEIVSLPADKRGSLIHKILAEFEERNLTQNEWIARVKEEYGAYVDDNLTGGGALDEIEVERLIEWIKLFEDMIASCKSVYQSAETEKTIAADIALGVKAKSPFRLKGRLDRLDSDVHGKKRIVDYKTGKSSDTLLGESKGLSDDSFNAGATLQIPLYMLAMTENTEEFIDISLEAAYWHLKDEKGHLQQQSIKFSHEFIEKNREELKYILSRVVEGIREGRFVPRPDVAEAGKSYCTYCDYKNICDGLSRKFIAYNDPEGIYCPWLAKLVPPTNESTK